MATNVPIRALRPSGRVAFDLIGIVRDPDATFLTLRTADGFVFDVDVPPDAVLRRP